MKREDGILNPLKHEPNEDPVFTLFGEDMNSQAISRNARHVSPKYDVDIFCSSVGGCSGEETHDDSHSACCKILHPHRTEDDNTNGLGARNKSFVVISLAAHNESFVRNSCQNIDSDEDSKKLTNEVSTTRN